MALLTLCIANDGEITHFGILRFLALEIVRILPAHNLIVRLLEFPGQNLIVVRFMTNETQGRSNTVLQTKSNQVK
jgi:hypothetical protein